MSSLRGVGSGEDRASCQISTDEAEDAEVADEAEVADVAEMVGEIELDGEAAIALGLASARGP